MTPCNGERNSAVTTGFPRRFRSFLIALTTTPAQECGTDQLRGAKPFRQRFPQVILTPEIRDVFDHGC
jgi:hypothetical protein